MVILLMLGWLHILFMLVQLGMMVEICFWERCWEKYPTYDAWTGYANGLTTYATWNYASAGKADGTDPEIPSIYVGSTVDASTYDLNARSTGTYGKAAGNAGAAGKTVGNNADTAALSTEGGKFYNKNGRMASSR